MKNPLQKGRKTKVNIRVDSLAIKIILLKEEHQDLLGWKIIDLSSNMKLLVGMEGKSINLLLLSYRMLANIKISIVLIKYSHHK